VRQLDRNLAHLAERIEGDLNRSVRDLPGAGAAGGLGAGLVAFLDAELRRGVDRIVELIRLPERVHDADLVITGEGRFDVQSSMGKTVSGVARCARDTGVPVIAIVGTAADGADGRSTGVDAVAATADASDPIPTSSGEAAERLTAGAERYLRSWKNG
jgi:glycerate kinase